MQGIYTYIPETNHVPREYSVAAILLLLFMVLISLVSALTQLYLYVSCAQYGCFLYYYYYYYYHHHYHHHHHLYAIQPNNVKSGLKYHPVETKRIRDKIIMYAIIYRT
jgi:Ca2+/Na+ antiporter